MYRYLTPEIVEGVHLREPDYAETVDQKMGLLSLGYIAVHDVDLTMTINGFPQREDLTSWGVMTPFYDETDKRVDQAMWEIFEQRQREGSLTKDQAQLWWEISLRMITKDRTPPENLTEEEFQAAYEADPQRYTPITRDMVREAGEKMRPRSGVHEYTEALRGEGVPNAWVTAGLADPCEAFAEKQGILPDILLGTRFEFDHEGILVDWIPNTVIHPLNKDEQSNKEIRALRHPDDFDGRYAFPGTLLIGDSTSDPRMVKGDKVLRISVANPHGANTEEFLASRFAAGYDMVLKDNGLFVAEAIVRRIGEIRRQSSQREA